MELLNVGCGANAREGWVNLDLNPGAAGVLACDVSQGLPFDPGVFDAVYCSHVLEHLPKAEAPALVAECLRVLRPGGIARFVVPDLEAIVRLYLRSLDRALLGRPGRGRVRLDDAGAF
jgi:predicted SAM-dependent methyltransferase